MKRLLVGLTTLATVLLALPAQVAHADIERHCIVQVTGRNADGQFTTAPPVCYASLGDAMRSIGVPVAAGANPSGGDLAASGALTTATATSTFIIGIHWDGFNWSGSSTTVVGSDCAGGYLNVSSAWNNRIRSTENGCNRIRHFDGYNLTGDWEETYYPGGNLTLLDRRTSSIQYLS